jgi:hypothetical protein
VAPGFALGTLVDIDDNGQPNANATGDDANGPLDINGNVIDDEDGISLLRPIVRGDTGNAISVFLTNTTGQNGYLHGWIDFNADGDWNDADEQIIANQLLTPGAQTIRFAAPVTATLSNTFARFRLSQDQGTGPTGRSLAGEVEDYLVEVKNSLEIAVDDRFTVARNSTNNLLNVLANDFSLPGDALRIVSVSAGSQGGRIQIAGGGTSIQYQPRNGFVGIESFDYTVLTPSGLRDTATVSVQVEFTFENPQAVDDSYDVATNTIGFPLNVLANDVEGRGGALQIQSVSTPDQGGQVTIGSGNQSLRYTPRRGFGGTERFTYTAIDGTGKTTSATVTVHTLAGDRADDVVDIQLRFKNMNNEIITAIPQGSQFKVDVLVDDLRAPANFTLAPGVYAAYMDLLYNAALVTPHPGNGGFSFAVDFAPGYTDGRLGTNEVPGLINDFGAFAGSRQLDEPNPVLLATLTFEALLPGLVDFAADPADSPPNTDVLLYNLPTTPVPIQQVRYGRAMLEIVGDSVRFPFAVDDSFPAPFAVGSIENVLNVLANDVPGSTESIRLVQPPSQPANGNVFIDDRGTSATNDDVIRYTPNSGFSGSDQFTYTIQDARGFTSSARVTVQVGNAAGDDLMELRLQATDLNGTPIDQIAVGQKFQLRGFVRDLRGNGVNRGIFAAFQDVLFNSALVGVDASSTNNLGFQVTFGPNYTNALSGDIRTVGIINEIGSVQAGNLPLGTNEFLQFTVTLTARSIGTVTFVGDPADLRPFHDSLTFEPPDIVPTSQIRYGLDSLNIVAGTGAGAGEGFTNQLNPLDVNADGFISAIDALQVINTINRGGSRPLTGDGGGEGEEPRMYVDVNADGYVSPLDVLQVLNHLNRPSEGEGEGSVDSAGGDDLGDVFDSIAGDVDDQWNRNRRRR